MERLSDRLSVMIAHAEGSAWTAGLESTLMPWPLDLHWSRCDTDAIALAASGGMHVAVVDDALPSNGGLAFLRRIRVLGLALPCVLVCGRADPRLLSDALALDAFSVVQAETNADLVAPTVLKIARQQYQIDCRAGGGLN